MRPKIRRRIDLICLLGIATFLLNYLGNDKDTPKTTEAHATLPVYATDHPNSAPCQQVIDQIVSIARNASESVNQYRSQPLSVVGKCVDRQERIDTAQCPNDFRNAEGRFLAAERSLWQDAKEDGFSSPDVVQRAFFDVYSHRSPYDTLDKMSDKVKHDLDIFQGATFDLIAVSTKYGVD